LREHGGCYDISKLLRHLTAASNNNIPVVTLSRAYEKSIPAHVQHKRSPVREVAGEKIFPGARNFK
jgi:error-prone DNA polymerase